MRMRRSTRALGAAFLALGLAACGGGGSSSLGGDSGDVKAKENVQFPEGSTMAELAKAGKIEVGIKYDQPLFGEQTISGFEGFDVRIAKLIAAELGISSDNITFTETVSENREPFLQQQKVDMVIATYTINEERDQVIDFAGPYYVAGQQIMVKKGNPLGIKGPEDLAGHKVCSARGSTPAANIKENYPKAAKTMVLFDEYSKCRDALQNGQVDAVTTDNVILSGFVYESDGKFELVGDTFSYEPYGIGVHQTKDKQFCTWINETLNKLYENGSWAKAYEATIGKVSGEPPTPPQTGSCEKPGHTKSEGQ